MSESEIDEHVWFREQIAAALLGGLDAGERVRFDAHAAACGACAAELSAARDAEKHMSELFTLPEAGLEDRIIDRLRAVAPRRLHVPRLVIHPAVRRAAFGVAAVIMLGGFGYLVTTSVEQGRAPAVSSSQVAAAKRISVRDGREVRYDAQDSIALHQSDHDDTVKLGLDLKADQGKDADRRGGATSDYRLHYFADPGRSNEATKTEPSRASRGGNLSISGGSVSLDAGANEKPKSEGGASRMYWDAGGTGGQSSSGGVGGANASFGVPGQSRGYAWFEPAQLGTAEGKAGETQLGRKVEVLRSGIEGVESFQQQKSEPAAERPAIAGQAPVAGAVIAPAPAPAPVTPPAAPQQPKAQEHVAQPTTRKVIRNGQMEFEVDRFDSAFAQVSKLTTEAGGYVGTTDSEKLPNGKVKGTVTIRVPPDRLDTLVMQLRGIGDLKSQKLEAQDISKQYSDLDSQLRAARAMEERLIAIIKEGKGQIKDLLAAEKELGVWREKVERIVGEMRYFDNLVALSTLNITLYERDIRTPATAREVETIEAGVETEDVEKSRADALKAIEDAKGRVIQSDMKRYDAGQFGATIVAEVPPDAAGPLLDRIRQIGKVARLDVQRRQTAEKTDGTSNAPVKVEKKDTRLNLSLYNLANVAPRQSSVMNVAAEDVESAYRSIIERVNKAGGRVITSNLAKNKPEQTTGTISFEVPTPVSDEVTAELRKLGEVMKLAVTENPDVNNVTTAKRGFSLMLVSSAAVAPRDTATVQVASAGVGQARQKILSAASAVGARVLTSQLNENDPANPNATIEIDVPRAALAAVEKVMAEAGDTISRVITRSSDTENTLDSKVKLQLTLVPAEKLPPRESTAMTIELSDVDSAMSSVQLSATEAGGRVAESNLSKDAGGNTTGKLAVEVPLAKAQSVIDQAKKQGALRAVQANHNAQVPAGSLARARIDVTFTTAETIVEPGSGVWATIRNGLATSVSGLLWSLQLIVVGLCFVVPWALILWGAWKLIKRRTKVAPVPTA